MMNSSRTTRNTQDNEWTLASCAGAMPNQTHAVSNLGHSVSYVHTVQAGSYDARGKQQYPDPCVRSPGVKSWYSEDEELSPGTSDWYELLYATDEMTERKSSVTQSAAHKESGGTSSIEIRKASTVTVSPSFTTSIQAPEFDLKRADADVVQRKPIDAQKDYTKGRSYFKRVKDFYREGPPGEGQELWNGLKAFWRERQTGAVLEMRLPTRADEASDVPSPVIVFDWNSADQPLHQQSTISCVKGPNAGQLKPRCDSVVSYSDISRTSREVPIKIRRTDLVVDSDKPLPPIPQLSNPPKRRSQDGQGKVLNLNKPLPRTPLPCSPEPPKPPQEMINESPVDAPWAPTVSPLLPNTRHDVPSQSFARTKPNTSNPQPPSWLQGTTPRASDTQLDAAGKGKAKSKPSKAEKAHAALKATISRPIPIPLALNLSPTHLPPHPGTMSAKAQGKQKAPSSPTWLNKLARPTMPTLPNLTMMHKAKRRPASDESFACQGLGEGHERSVYGIGAGLSVQDGGPRMREEDEMKPEPLFTGRMSDGSYYDGGDVYADQRGLGRWI